MLFRSRTPWRDLDEAGAGWVRSLDDAGEFSRIIEAFADSAANDKAAMAGRALAYASRVARSPDVISLNRALFMP